MAGNIQLVLAGSQGGYSVTWGNNVVTDLRDGGTGYVILNYFDGSSDRFDDDDISLLAGNSYYNVVSIILHVETPGGSGTYDYHGYIPDEEDLDTHTLVDVHGYGHTFSNYGYSYTKVGTIYLGTDMHITFFSMSTID